MKQQLLLISSSRCEGGGYLEHCAEAIKVFLGAIDGYVAFVPYALKDHGDYAQKAEAAFAAMGYKLLSVHTIPGMMSSHGTKAVFVGGGNTFRLSRALWQYGLIDSIRKRVGAGEIKYIGTSAGSNMACPTIKTTNDMPIVELPDFYALGLVNFQINPHFVPGNLVPGHMGETRETRIKEFHEENDTPVVGLTETNWITVNGNEATLHGKKDAFIFERNKELRMWQPETTLQL